MKFDKFPRNNMRITLYDSCWTFNAAVLNKINRAKYVIVKVGRDGDDLYVLFKPIDTKTDDTYTINYSTAVGRISASKFIRQFNVSTPQTFLLDEGLQINGDEIIVGPVKHG